MNGFQYKNESLEFLSHTSTSLTPAVGRHIYTTPKGFDMGSAGTSDMFLYDPFGNLKSDPYKGITDIKYNHLNLPTEITFDAGGKIEYFYDATGTKRQKKVTQGSTITTTDYRNASISLSTGGFQFVNNTFEFFPHAEGYVKATPNGSGYSFNYVFTYTDHLGNIRLKYAEHPQTGETTIRGGPLLPGRLP